MAAWRLHGAAEPRFRSIWDLATLILLLAAIGIGSGLWHSVASRWSLLADVIPIALFINLYLLSFGWRVLGLRWLPLVGLWLAYQGLSISLVSVVDPGALNGSIGYLPALAFLVGFWWVLARRRHPMSRYLGAAALLFGLSLTFRTLDSAICPWLSFGTHFLWHGLNAVVLYVLLAGLIRFRQRP